MKIPSKYNEYKLCCVESSEYIGDDITLYFTEKPLEEQWGDDWDDSPYEHNAGEPYEYDYNQPEQGVENGRGIYPPIDIYKVKFYGDTNIVTPRTGQTNSRYSVADINGITRDGKITNKARAWLEITDYKDDKTYFVWAGATLKETLDTIKAHCNYVEFYGLVKED